MSSEIAARPDSKTERPPAWHSLSLTATARRLDTDSSSGLEPDEAARRARRDGPNVLDQHDRATWPTLLLRQFADILIGILLVAAAVSAAIGEFGDAFTIAAIVVLNAAMGFAQEWKAERALDALRRMLSPRTRVVRSGVEQEIDARLLVQGDLVRLEIGDRVPADLRLTEALNLEIDESALTGESVPATKSAQPTDPAASLAERSSMGWMGTAVTNGRAAGIVVATGMRTEFGRIARLTQAVQAGPTSLQRRLAVLGRQLGAISVATAVLVALAGWLGGKPLLEMFMTGVALAVAVVPEGLPAVVTITLALGIRAMLRRRVLLRRLQAAETLGSATVICSDKTGTLTQNQMTVQRIWLPAGSVDVTGSGYDPAGHFEAGGERVDYRSRDDLLRFLRAGLICSNARVHKDGDTWNEVGAPTEAALVVAAYKAWLHPADEQQILAEFSFNSTRKRMTRVLGKADGASAYVKGAPEVLLERCTRIADGRGNRPMTDEDRARVQHVVAELSSSGLRTLAVADRRLPASVPLDGDAVEADLTLLGIAGILDPPRPGVTAAIRTARAAGIRTLMVTGDAPGTALAIARRTGLPAERAVTGRELDELDDEALRSLLDGRVLFARTTPEHKLRLVTALQREGHVVGMTGDGVNDAPALRRADIGIAMGLRGTEVARGAADMVLTDDDYSSIVAGIEEGRREYDNIARFVRYLLSSNAGEVLAITTNILLGGPLILLPVQILWMNLVTDGMTAVALGTEPAEPGIMQRPPRRQHERILSGWAILAILTLGGWIAGSTLWLFHEDVLVGGVDRARTLAFAGIVVLEKANVLNFRSLCTPLARIGWTTNPWLLLAILVTLGLQLLAVYAPPLQRLLHTVPLDLADWGRIAIVAVPIFVVPEFGKWLIMRTRRNADSEVSDERT